MAISVSSSGRENHTKSILGTSFLILGVLPKSFLTSTVLLLTAAIPKSEQDRKTRWIGRRIIRSTQKMGAPSVNFVTGLSKSTIKCNKHYFFLIFHQKQKGHHKKLWDKFCLGIDFNLRSVIANEMNETLDLGKTYSGSILF